MIQVLKFIVIIVFSLFFRVRISGRQNVPDKGPYILCANHVGELDMFFIGYRIRRLIHWMAKEELFRNFLLGAVITWLGAFPVKRGKGDIGAIKTAFRLLKEGHIVGIFPEGHRRKNGVALKAHSGAAMIAVKADVEILPVALEGSMRPFSKVRVVFGKPFKLNTDNDKKYTNEEFAEMSENIMRKIYGLLEEK